jgi:indolepyruvate ferredoxin oxidoreductase
MGVAVKTEQPLAEVSLGDKYDLDKDLIYLTGTQALVRLCLMQRERDRRAGKRTAGFVSGYRGSPLGGVDQQFTRAARELKAADIKFQPGLNEDLAATAVWGTQQVTMRGEGRVDGVFAVWYGKGPGVDRTGDVFRHGNLAGSDPNGGVLALLGDDHVAESSTTAHQSEYALVDAMMPILSPAGVQEILDYGLYGFAMSRFSGTWVGLKCVKDTVESTTIVRGRVDRVNIVMPTDVAMPADGINIRPRDGFLPQEERLHRYKIPAVQAFTRANGLDKLIFKGGSAPHIGIVSAGKSYLDVRQALQDLGVEAVDAEALGVRLYKIGVTWPLEPQGILSFAQGLDLILVVEEKRGLVEGQIRDILYGRPGAPIVIGKKDEQGDELLASYAALDINDIAIAIGRRLEERGGGSEALGERLKRIEAAQQRLRTTGDVSNRTPYFCAGCPHSTSTRIPEGARAYAGIGCHYMTQWMDRSTEGYTQMGGEGASWVGEAGFSTRDHVFQNLGDGTYNHSGSLALRFAAGSGVNITYKILFNDAVAMTGGQPHDGGLSVPKIAAQVAAEGVSRIAVVTDDPDKYPRNTPWPFGTSIHHRSELIPVQQELAKVKGVTVMIYDQTCAAEKRRRRKRGTFPDPDRRIIINERVCEGCGDCGAESNCVAVQPVETLMGRKRRIDQSACNKDFSCVEGFCPSFVSVSGAKPRKPAPVKAAASSDIRLFDPVLPEIDGTYNILVTGLGGTGVVTVGGILSMAAHLEGKGCGVIDMAGLAQKGGAVFSHIRIAREPEDITAIRIGAGGADFLFGGDIAVAGTAKALAGVKQGRTRVVANTAEVLPGDFTRNIEFSLPVERVKRALSAAVGKENSHFVDANRMALALLGDTIAANLFLLGYGWQSGAVPLSEQALMRAIEINGEAVAMNKAAFEWGRRAAIDPEGVTRLVEARGTKKAAAAETEEQMHARHVAFLTAYQNAAYAARYAGVVERVRKAEPVGRRQFSEAVARSLFKLMAYKDEYEVARLYTDGAFLAQLADTFDGDRLRLRFHLAPPILGRKDPVTGRPRKTTFGPWVLPLFRILARLKGLRGTKLDIFGYTKERRTERQLVVDYIALIDRLLSKLSGENYDIAVRIAELPLKIRGFGHVKERNLQAVKTEEVALLAQFERPRQFVVEAAE